MEINEAYKKVADEIKKKFHFPKDYKFDYCISNPPYQHPIEGKRSQPIYYHFFLIQGYLGRNVCNIFPIAWQKVSGKGHYGKGPLEIQNDKRIVSIDNYFEDGRNGSEVLFKTASTGG